MRWPGAFLGVDLERDNGGVYSEWRYRAYPRTPGEDLLNPKLAEHENKFYLARAGPSRSQINLDSPDSPNGRDLIASGSQTPVGGSQTPHPDDMRHHARHGSSGSSGSQFLEVPLFPPIAAVVATPEQQSSSRPSSG